jgi:hypothetical protein
MRTFAPPSAALELDASNADTRQALAEARKAVDDMRRRPSVEELKGKAADFLAKNRQAALLALPRLFLVINALLYILPLSAAFSMGCYRRAVMGAMATYATLLFQKHGRPHFSMQVSVGCKPLLPPGRSTVVCVAVPGEAGPGPGHAIPLPLPPALPAPQRPRPRRCE